MAPRRPWRYAFDASRAGRHRMITGPGDEMVPSGGPGDMRASHADRERVIDTVKAAFARGQLTAGELDARVGQALTARTYAELTAVTLSIPRSEERGEGKACGCRVT